jgi:hypothetical protein
MDAPAARPAGALTWTGFFAALCLALWLVGVAVAAGAAL